MLRMITQGFSMSLQNIKSNKMRSFLTMLGIIIGVGAVIGLVTIVQAVTDNVMNQFSSLGAGSISVSVTGTPLKRGLNDNDLDTLRDVDGVSGIAPSVSVSTAAAYNSTVYDKVSVSGVDVVYFQHNDVIGSGRAFTEAEAGGDVRVCIVDEDFVQNIMHGDAAIGNMVRLHGQAYKIIGIQKSSNSLMSAMTDTSSMDGSVMVPYRNALNMSGAHNVSSVTVYYNDNVSSSAVEKNLRSALNNMFNDADNAFTIINMESLMDVMNQIQSMMMIMLGGIAGISLLVGGIGIMNMMLVSVTERTKEIGLRKALGAEPARIQAQFLIESITLSLIGGIIGILFGLLVAYVGVTLISSVSTTTVPFTVSSGAILLGFGFSAAVGIIFGWAPARRASRLNPIDALRSE